MNALWNKAAQARFNAISPKAFLLGKVKCRLCGRTLPWHLHEQYKDDPVHKTCLKRQENWTLILNPTPTQLFRLKEKTMPKTKLGILKEMIEDLHVLKEIEVLDQIIACIDNPLGVVPGDKIDVWDSNIAKTRTDTFAGYLPNEDFCWLVKRGGRYRNAQLPAKPVELSKDQKKVLDDIDAHLGANCTSLRSRLSEAFKLGE